MLVQPLQLELHASVNAFAEHDANSVATLRAAWTAHYQWMVGLWETKCKTMGTAAREAHGDPQHFQASLVPHVIALPPFLPPSADEGVTGAATNRLGHHLAVITEIAASSEHGPAFAELVRTLATIREDHARASQQYQLDASTLAGAALSRIRRTARGLVPAVVAWNPLASIPAMLDKAAHWWGESQVSLALFEQNVEDQARLQLYVNQTRRDLATLALELRDHLLEQDELSVEQPQRVRGLRPFPRAGEVGLPHPRN